MLVGATWLGSGRGVEAGVEALLRLAPVTQAQPQIAVRGPGAESLTPGVSPCLQALEELFQALDLEKRSFAVGRTQVRKEPVGQAAALGLGLPVRSVPGAERHFCLAGLPEGRGAAQAGAAAGEAGRGAADRPPGRLQGLPLPPEVPAAQGTLCSPGCGCGGGWTQEQGQPPVPLPGR